MPLDKSMRCVILDNMKTHQQRQELKARRQKTSQLVRDVMLEKTHGKGCPCTECVGVRQRKNERSKETLKETLGILGFVIFIVIIIISSFCLCGKEIFE